MDEEVNHYETVDILPNQTLYIKNLNDTINPRDLIVLLYELFIPYGEILDIIAKKSSKLRGQAFVVFSELASAIAAKKGVNGRLILNKEIEIEYAKKQSYKALKPGDYYRLKMSNVNKPAEEQPEDINQGDCHTVFVENLPNDMQKDAVEVLFKQYPGYKDVRYIEGRGVAFVDFATAYQAEVALQGLQGFKISHNYDMKLSLAK
ncbi:bifunctional RNA recognition motif domain/RNA-binding domain superfamily/Nucleotide-binding alpha-beta plait domain superfamily [Babesia duncani]|uniref:Bifunctional RNA recognition motif domain/RNA-binding domain superfamily/Nucleotide-binding alpha-beta plait domain superfamily n=1 Tax=Babesia duncani TaxID=323732 RepID=A0AAD9PKP3_9APIC|nr:bifunctional RNA recognition motif domain/RNA-binding domain superfamily/Nucleotide-binding alpha-beta plait domain superfamily [Babesia duncani]